MNSKTLMMQFMGDTNAYSCMFGCIISTLAAVLQHLKIVQYYIHPLRQRFLSV